MGRYRSRSCSPRRHSQTPPRRRHYDEPRKSSRKNRSYRDRRSPAPSGLLVRNIPLDARPEDLWIPFERFGPVKDVYLPKDYYTGEPRGFGFVKFRDGEDASEAKHHLNHTLIGGREISIVFAEENRKTPQEMLRTPQVRVSSRSGRSHRRRTRSPSRSPRRRYHSSSRSPSPARRHSRDRNLSTRPRRSRSRGRSISRPRSKSQYLSPRDDKSPIPKVNENDLRPHTKRDHQSDRKSQSPKEIDEKPRDKRVNGRYQKSPSPKEKYKSLSRSPSRSYSPRSPSLSC